MTIMTLPVYNPRTLATELRERGLPGARSATAITRLRRERARRRQPVQAPLPVEKRLTAALLARYRAEIVRRGGEIVIADKSRDTELSIANRRDGLVLLHAEGWRYYGRNAKARPAALSYLAGMEDGWPWAVRVPGTIETVTAALRFITPASVRDAQHAGKRVLRQGDVYAVETTKAYDGLAVDQLPESHRWNPTTRYLTHRPADGRKHRPLRVSFPVRFVRQTAYEMGRSGAWGHAD